MYKVTVLSFIFFMDFMAIWLREAETGAKSNKMIYMIRSGVYSAGSFS